MIHGKIILKKEPNLWEKELKIYGKSHMK